MFALVLAISYTTCSVVIYFRDLQQIVGIGLQIGMWATPVLWQLGTLSKKAQMLVKINPLVYIVEGYRSSIYEKQWFLGGFLFHDVFLDYHGGAVLYRRACL